MRSRSSRFILRLAIVLASILFSATPGLAQTFKNPLIIPTTTNVLALASADLNHDGKPDLVYIDGQQFNQRTIHVLLGNGDGTFSHGQDTLLPPGTCCGITIADVTGDGIPDLILPGGQEFTSQIVVMVGNGDGTFQTPLVSTFQETNAGVYVGFNPIIGVGDVNGDGKVDLVANDETNGQLDVLLGDGTGKFTLASIIRAYLTSSVYLVDLTGNHILDLVVTDRLGNDFAVLLGNGDGTFQTLVRYTGGAGILADLEGDGHPDMVVENYPAAVGYFKGNPDGTFGPLTSLGSATSPSALSGVVALNSGGLPDLIFATPNGIGVEMDTGNLVFSQMKLSVSGSTSSVLDTLNLAVGDFNSDGNPDIAMAVEGGIAILLGKGDGTFASADLYDIGEQVGAVAVANFMGNKLPDIAVTLAATFPRLLVGDGKGNFTLGADQNTSYGSQTPASNIVTGDFRGDGNVDVSFGTQTIGSPSFGTQSVAFGNGDGTFTTPAAIANASPIVADFNNDGRSDMLSISGVTVTVLLGQTNETFNTVTTTLRNPSPVFGVGDVNNDGKLDLVLNYSDHLEIWLGNGDGSFTYSSSIDNQGLAYAAIEAVKDVDGDGNADILFGPNSTQEGPTPGLEVLYGNGNGTFQAPVSLPVSHAYTQIVVIDVNGDKKPDLVMTDGVGVAVMMNLGGRKFGPETYYVAGQSVSMLSVADVNGDGFPDIVAANPSGTTVAVLLNQPNGVSPEGAPTIGNLTFAPGSPISGQAFTATLTISGVTSGLPVPTGSVDFSIDGGFVATVPLTNGAAAYNVTQTLIPVPYTITSTYSGDKTYAPANFAAILSVQPPVYQTQTALSASPSAALTSQTIHLVATVTSTPPSPGGIVTFYDGATPIGAATINSQGIAIHDTAVLSAGGHSLTAEFQGFTQLGYATTPPYTAAFFAASTSSPTIVTVTANATTSLLSTSNPSPAAGTVVTLTLKVSSPAGVPFGGATFFDGITVLGTLGLEADGSASFSTASLSTGSHSITAAFNANGPFAGSTSTPVSVSVSLAPASAIETGIALVQETNPNNGSQTLVASVNASQGLPAGIVTFLDNGAILGTAGTDPSGMATLPVGALPSGIHRLSASFGGGAAFAPSVSPVIHDQWPGTGPGFNLSIGARILRLTPEGSRPMQVGVEPLGAFGQQVQLACAAGVPAGYACEFSPSALDGSGASTLMLLSQTNTASRFPGTLPLYAIVIGLVSVGLVGGRGRRLRGLLLVCAACCTLGILAGCGMTTPNATRAQIVVLTIQASSGAGSTEIVHSAQISLIVPSSN